MFYGDVKYYLKFFCRIFYEPEQSVKGICHKVLNDFFSIKDVGGRKMLEGNDSNRLLATLETLKSIK